MLMFQLDSYRRLILAAARNGFLAPCLIKALRVPPSSHFQVIIMKPELFWSRDIIVSWPVT